MSASYEPLTARVLRRAQADIHAVRASLREADCSGWYVFATCSWEISPQHRVLYVVTPSTSLPMTRSLASALEAQPVWISGTVEGQVLPVDLAPAGDSTQPIAALELILVVRPWTDDHLRGFGGASVLTLLIDAAEVATLHLIMACERRPEGWPR